MSDKVKRVLIAAAALALVAGIAAAKPGPAPKPLRLDDATMIVEVNATDGDAGIQAFLDGEAWRSMTITGPGGRTVLDVAARGRLSRLGLTELFTESNEPPFDELPLRRFLRRFPEGSYRFVGETVQGRRLAGRARLSHAIPSGPRILSPAEGSSVARDAVAARWSPGDQPRGVRIAGYRAIVEREDPLRVLSVELPRSARSVTIPAEFLEPGTGYKLELQAIEASGNQTTTEISFQVD